MIVTDIIWRDDEGLRHKGFSMDGYLAENLAEIPNHQKKDWDVIGIVSGSGKVRIAKSTMAFQVATYVAWVKAGGQMCFDRKSKDYGKVIKAPTEKVKFGLDDVVFGVDNLMNKAHNLPKMSILVLDEEEGLGAKSTMMSLNRKFERFLQECGVYNHFVIIVLPDFFSLNKDFATGRSNFLINTYIGDNFQRGLFSFYSEHKKELMYGMGKKLIGNYARYTKVSPNFRGKFSKWLPFSREEYEKKKRDALNKRRVGQREMKIMDQRDCLFFLLKKHTELTHKDIVNELGEILGKKISIETVKMALIRLNRLVEVRKQLEEL